MSRAFFYAAVMLVAMISQASVARMGPHRQFELAFCTRSAEQWPSANGRWWMPFGWPLTRSTKEAAFWDVN